MAETLREPLPLLDEQGEAAATFYVVHDGSNDVTWRCEWPAEAVGGRVAKIPAGAVIKYPNRDTPLPWVMVGHDLNEGRFMLVDSKDRWDEVTASRARLADLDVVFPDHQGVAVFTRPDIDRAALALKMQEQGVRTVAETDDNYLAGAQHNLFMRQQGANEVSREAHARSMASLRVNVFSTGWLRDRYAKDFRERFGKQGLKQVEMHVCRNHVPSDRWPEIGPYDGPVRVGFMGSTSHLWDVHLAYAAFHAAKHLGAKTWMVGYNPANPDPDQPETIEVDGELIYTHSDKSRAVSARWARVVDEHVRWIAPGKYHRAALPFDIGIAPLHYNTFSAARSDSKMLEYTISGAVGVCSATPPYTEAGWVDGVNCLMANSPEEYAYATVRLLKDRGLREGLLEAAQAMVREERCETQLREEWGAALAL